MATLTSDWVPLIASAWTRYTPISYRSLALIAAIALLSYIFGYLASQIFFLSARAPTASFHENKGAMISVDV